MYYKGKQCRQLILKLPPTIQINDLILIMEDISLPELNHNAQNIKYALLELINNSLRAHREHAVDEPVIVNLKRENSSLCIEVKDKGQGFNLRDLPYDFTCDPGQIDIYSTDFKEYQAKNNFKRFGVGLLLARKLFPGFHLHFYNHAGRPAEWQAGKTSGTIINLEIGVTGDGT